MPDFIRLLLASLRFQDIFDIAIVAYIFYRLILVIRNTRAMMLLQGLFVLSLLSLVSRTFNFRAISWLLNTLLPIGFLAIPIIFQNELRRALEELGRGVAFASGMASGVVDNNQNEQMFEQLIKAVEQLASQSTGALIVMERQTGLQEYMNTGIIMDSVISYQLLINTFIPDTPLHDGALIIRGDRIAAAACYLPLSPNDQIAQELGTRHRAAIGLSELSDALVIVVSEETGTISLAQAGKLTRYLDGKMLHEMLKNLYAGPKLTNGFMRWLTGGGKADA